MSAESRAVPAPRTSPWAIGAHRAGPAQARRAPAEALRLARERNSVARAGIALAIAGLPVLRPALGYNLGPADAAIVLGVGATLLWVGATRQLVRSAYVLPVTIIVVAGLISGLAGVSPQAGVLAVVQDIYLALWALACLNFGRSGAALGFLIRTWCVTSILWAVALFIIVGRTVLTATQGDTRLAFISDTNGAGLYFVLCIFVLLSSGYPRRLPLRLFGIVMLLLDTVLTGSLGALTGLLAGLAVGLVVGVFSRRGPAPALALALAIGFAVGAVALYAQRNHVIDAAHASSNAIVRNSIGRGAQSSAERQDLTKETLGLVATSGLVGSGPNTTEQVLRDEQAAYVKQAHDDWIASLVERGVLGLFGLALLTVELGRKGAAVRNPARLEPAFARAVPAAHYLLGGLATVAVFSFTHEVLHDRTAWTLFGVLAALAVWGTRPTPLARGGQ